MKNYFPSNIKQLTKCFHEKTMDPVFVTKQSLKLAKKIENLNAFVRTTPEKALSQAKKVMELQNSGKKMGLLDGVPIAIKDNFCTNGIHTTCASRMLQDFIPTYNSTVFEKLENLGAVLIGKTNMDQFGMGSGTIDSIFGPTKNVWSENLEKDSWRIAGGSSGGSAVAVASGVCLASIGSDTGGSTRNPSSYCGVVGLKASYGLISRHGLIPLVNSMDVPGIMTRTVDDSVLMLNALAGPDPRDSTTIKEPFQKITLPCDENLSVRHLKIGIPKEYHCEGLSSEVLETWMKIADLLEEAGADVQEVSMPNTSSSIFVYSILNQCEVSSNMSRYDGIEFGHRSDENFSTEQLYAKTRAEGFNNVVKNRILAGNYFLLKRNYDKYFEQALKVRRLISNDFLKVFHGKENFDVLLTPTTLSEAPIFRDFIQSSNRDQCAIQDFCTQPANMAGIPAISIPIRLSENKLPLSLQIMGPNLGEKQILTVAKWIEQRVQFPSIINKIENI